MIRKKFLVQPSLHFLQTQGYNSHNGGATRYIPRNSLNDTHSNNIATLTTEPQTYRNPLQKFSKAHNAKQGID